jgi:hypothetical protein
MGSHAPGSLARRERTPGKVRGETSSYSAEIAAEAFADFFERGPRLFVEQMQGRENHSGSANAALRATAVEEGLLQHLQAAVGCESFDRYDF